MYSYLDTTVQEVEVFARGGEIKNSFLKRQGWSILSIFYLLVCETKRKNVTLEHP